MFNITNKVALITGGAGGIGFEFAKALLQKSLKAVVLIDINESNGQKALTEIEDKYGKDRAVFVKADVSNKIQLESAFETTVKNFNQLDIVINNAGTVQELQWEKCINVNLVATIMGSMLAMEKYLPKYKCGAEGVIVNISSILGIYPFESIPVYSATKHAIIGYSRCIGGPLHYKTSNVRVVTICPGATETPILYTTTEQIKEPFQTHWLNSAVDVPRQSSAIVAQHAIKIIQSAPSGSVWRIYKSKCVEVQSK